MKPLSKQAAGHNPDDYPRFAVTVDIAVFTVAEGALRVLLIQRGEEPHLGAWALPGGFVHEDEDLDSAAIRELHEETSIKQAPGHLEQFGAYGDPDRDPRQRVVTVGYWAVVTDPPEPVGGGDAAYAEFVAVSEVESGRIVLAFDHKQIFDDVVERVRKQLETTGLGRKFLEPEFTISELRQVYNAAWDANLDAGNFQRKVSLTDGFLVPANKKKPKVSDRGGRPASLWTSGPAEMLDPPITRPPKD